jgi:hypothetical protein
MTTKTNDGDVNYKSIFASEWDSVDSGAVLLAKDGRTRFDNIKKQMTERLTEVAGENDIRYIVDFFSEGYLNEMAAQGWFVLNPNKHKSISDAFSIRACQRMGVARNEDRITFGHNEEMIACCIREDVLRKNRRIDKDRREDNFARYVPNGQETDRGNLTLDCSVEKKPLTEA